MTKQSGHYRTNNVLVTMGGDFTYQQAGMWFENLDKLIQYSNLKAAKDNLNITLLYSTPDCYLKAVKDATPVLSMKQDDFFPYASDPHSYWTGYFTSRPTTKYLEAQTNTYLQVVKQLQFLGRLQNSNMAVLNELKTVMGVMQHHDAVTGTEKQHVASDYVRMVSQATQDAHLITTEALNRQIFGDDAKVQLSFDRCHFNESRCETTEYAADMIITVYNPLAWPVNTPVHIPIVDAEYDVMDGGVPQTVQIVDLPDTILRMPSRSTSISKKRLSFIARLPALGYKCYYMSKNTKRNARDIKYEEISDLDECFEKIRRKNYEVDIEDNNVVLLNNVPDEPMRNENFNYNVNTDKEAKALLKTKQSANDKNVRSFERLFPSTVNPTRPRVEDNPFISMSDEEMRMLADDPRVVERFDDQLGDEAKSDTTYIFTPLQSTNRAYILRTSQNYYPATVGNNENFNNRSSGAYIFRPKSTDPIELRLKDEHKVTGALYDEIRITTHDNAAFNYRYYKDPNINYHEVDYVVGPIDITDDIGKEYIIRFNMNATTNGVFYSDSNGRQMLKRKLNKRPQWNVTVEEPVAANYYPVVAGIYIKEDVDTSPMYLAVLPDRAVGASSLEEGSIEVMLHRRLLHDDAFGVGEALNETEFGQGLVVTGTLRYYFDAKPISFKEILENRLKPQVFVSDAHSVPFEDWKKLKNEVCWLQSALPDGVHLLTLEPFENPANDNKILIRLENYLDESEYSTKVVDLSQILSGTNIKEVEERLLAANVGLDDERWSWSTDGEFAENFNKEYGNTEPAPRARDKMKVADDRYRVNLAAKQIRTFVLTLF